MNDLKTVYISEWSKLSAEELREKYNLRQLVNSDFKLINEIENKLKIRQLSNGIEIESNSYVGVVKLNNFQIIISPKITNFNLAKMIAFAYDLESIEILNELNELATDKANISDIISLIFLKETENIFYQGLRKRYQEKEEDIASCRGKINFNKLAKNSSSSVTLPCRYQELTVDIEENQIILAALRLLLANTNNRKLKKKLNILFSKIKIEVSLRSLSYQLLTKGLNNSDRLNNNYKNLFRLVELLLRKEDFNLLGEQDNDFPGFLLDMNLLFERFLKKYFKSKLSPGVKVEAQKSLKNKFRSDKLSYNLIPDYQFFEDGKLVRIADAKYKNYEQKKVSVSDLYQLTAYALANKGKINQVYLFYPGSKIESKTFSLNNLARDIKVEIIAQGLNIERILDDIENKNLDFKLFD
ncbi:5-methylcytosine-specific restriction enzyme subunit McrC [Halanaerobium sp. MA284_MarDTE_T2]|nr:5-methylcytosine-specific restriction enzyme subunit McrC [Halanaerobium sp. MA284_MarDTE_T2]